MLETVKGAKGGSQSQRQPKVANDTTASKTYARLQYGMSEGEVEGLANGYKSIYLDDTPVENDSGARNFQDVTLDFRSGTNDQTYMEGFESIASETAVGVELKSDTPWVKGVTNLTLDAVIVRVRFGALKQQDPKNGDVSGIVIDYTIEVQTDGGSWELMLDTQMSGKTSANYERTHRIGLPEANNNWLIRVTRKTPNSSSEYVSDKMYIQAITEVVDLKLAYPNTALIGVQYDAETFSNIAKIAVDLKGVKIKVPSNYDPVSRTYIGIWDGLFKRAYSNNPAWIYYDLCTNKRYALGNRLTEQMIDKWSLYRLAQYCDQLVPNGKGGQEPRFACNVYIQSAESAFDILSKLAGLFRAISYWDGASIVCEADLPQDTMFTYTSANIIDGAMGINYTGTRARDRHNAVKVAWDNPQNRYKTEYVFVRDEAAIARDRGVKLLELEAWGCTSEGQAQRTGQWALKTEQLETRTVTFKVGLDGYIPLPGKVIELADELLAGRANGGRISSVSADLKQITLDRDDVVCRAGDRLVVNGEDGKAQARVVSSIAGRIVTVVSAFDSVAPQNVWVIDAKDLATMKFRVVSISQDEQHQFTITAIQHNESKFDAIDHGAYIDDRPISIINPTTQDPVESVSISSEQMVQQGMFVETMVISWPQAKGATKYQVEWRKDNGTWLKLPLTGNNSAEIAGIYAGKYEARVIAMSAFDISSLPTYSILTELTGKQGKPPKVAFIQATGILFGMKLDWSYPANALDTAYVEIQVSPDSKSNIATLGSFAYPTTTTVIQGLQPNLTQFYRARLIDRIGNIGDWSDWTNGTTTSDAKDVLELLDDQITDSQLNQDLISRIEIGSEARDLVVEVNKIATAAHSQAQILTNALATETAERRDEVKALNEGLTQEVTRSKDADRSQTETLDNYKASIDGTLSNVQTRVNTIATETEANTSKLISLDSVIEGKADASVVQNLKNDVLVIGDQVNSQSSIISGLQNSLEGKADASALTALDSKVATLDGNVVSQGQAITALENSIAGKADSSALNSLKSTVEEQGNTITSQGQAITSVKANLDNISVGAKNLLIDSEFWSGGVAHAENIETGYSADLRVFTIKAQSPNNNWVTGFLWAQASQVDNRLNADDDCIFSVEMMYEDGSFPYAPQLYWKDSMTYMNLTLAKGQVQKVGVWQRYYHTRKYVKGGFAFHFGVGHMGGTYHFRRPVIEKGNIPSDWSLSEQDFASATAVNKLDATTTRHDDEIKANASAVTGLKSAIEGKADANALNSLKTTVEQQGNTISSQGQALTQVEAKADLALNGRKFPLDLSSLDPNLYYPVLIPLMGNGIGELAFEMPLGKFAAPWSSHGGGTFALSLHWKARASGWGAQDIERQVVNFSYLWTQSNQSPAMWLGQLTHSSQEYVLLRGGTWYELTCNQYTGTPKIVIQGRWEGDEYIEPQGYDASMVPVSINNKLNATATATNNLEATLTQINGKVEANSQAITQVGTTVGNASINVLTDSKITVDKPVGQNPYPFWSRAMSKSLVYGKTYTLVFEAEFTTGGGGSSFSAYVHGNQNLWNTTSSFGRQVIVVKFVQTSFDTGTGGAINFYITGWQPDQNNSFAKVYWACLYEDDVSKPPLQWQPNSFENSALVQQSLQSINGIKAQYTLKTDVDGYIAGIGLINEGSGKSLFIIRADQFAIAAPTSVGNEAKYAFNYQAGPVTLPNGTVVPAGLYLDNANIGYISASKIYADSLSAISANLGTIKVKEANIDDLAVSTLKIKDNAVTVPVGIKLVSPIQRSSQRSATVFTGGDAVILDTSNYFGDIISLSLNRSGGKCQISGYVYIDNVCASAWRSNGSTVSNAPKTMYCGVVLYRNGSPIFIGRVAASSEITNDVAIFNGAVQLPTIIDDAYTGNAQYSIRVGWSTTIADAGLMIRPWNTGNASVLTATLSVLELKK
ncbi:TipJ family phage tail tip protein [Acinetobacter bereziniae]|uniref:TipJ family phage tail tip protein n=1 Tax=Acinetobacter bereziniae TaxID=106648 RepID=UPI00124CBDAF|nr:phage tail protein [Acinetobacter bereziniae]